MNENTTVLTEEISEAELLMAADGEAVETIGAIEETTAATVERGEIGFTPENLTWALPIMGKGMLGIFIVTTIIVVTVNILDRATKIKFRKKDKES